MSDYQDEVRRAALPEVMFIPDVALALHTNEGTAQEAVLRGDCGPYIRVGGSLALLRESFLQALSDQQEYPLRPLADGEGDPNSEGR